MIGRHQKRARWLRTTTALIAILPLILVSARRCHAVAPILYHSSGYQSPVVADPDDLLLLPGYGLAASDTVVYLAVTNAARAIQPPRFIPPQATSEAGFADVVSVVDTPYSLTIRLPAVAKKNQPYALWVINAKGEQSNGIIINDARPLWVSPTEVYASATLATLPRSVKIVGRNMQPNGVGTARVRLIGTRATYTLTGVGRGPPNAAGVNSYVVTVQLPDAITVGRYAVQFSRDGFNWVPLPKDSRGQPQVLDVQPDPVTPRDFLVGKFTFGSCIPDDGTCVARPGVCSPDPDAAEDQTLCVVAAVAAANVAGGVVVFGRGTWNMDDAGEWGAGKIFSTKGVSRDGILVRPGVSLRGAGLGTTRLVRGARWDMHLPSFALLGSNQVGGFSFIESRVFRRGDLGTGFLMLGTRWDRVSIYQPVVTENVSHVVISDNEFDKPFIAIGSDGVSLDHIVVIKNTFGAYSTAIALEGNALNIAQPYHFRDSIVDRNTFMPGSALDVPAGQGTIATAMTGGQRVDFSNNVADGSSRRYLYDSLTDESGWRAAFFWAMNDNVETTLVSENIANCTGDKDGDGEAISYDNNHNRPAFDAIAVPVIAAHDSTSGSASTIRVRGALIERQLSYGNWIDVRPVNIYYVGDWLQIVRGAGIGQARKIIAIATINDREGPSVEFTVTPAFDVLPRKDSLAAVGRIYWQTYTVGNSIDHRAPLCLKSNRTRPAGGVIVLYASTADSVVAGNVQFDTSGIQLSNIFQMRDRVAGIAFPSAFIQSSNEIRGNEINGAYDQSSDVLALHGISIGFGATPHTVPPPIVSFGLSVSHNKIREVGGSKGAIALNQGWYTGPESRVWPGITPWKLAMDTLLFQNSIVEGVYPKATPLGIGISAGINTTPVEWRSVIYGNSCGGSLLKHNGLVDLGTQTVVYCPHPTQGSCECNSAATDLKIGLSEVPNDATPSPPSSEAYTLIVSNKGPSKALSVTLTAEPFTGSVIKSMASTRSQCNIADENVNLCRLGTVEVGEQRKVDVVISSSGVGVAQVVFSVAHEGPGLDVRNNSLIIPKASDR